MSVDVDAHQICCCLLLIQQKLRIMQSVLHNAQPGSLLIPHIQYHATTNLARVMVMVGLGLVIRVGRCMILDVW